MTSFEHPALSAAASQLSALRAAGTRLGAPDPVAALRQLDCSPETIRESAAQVGTGSSALTAANVEFRDGVERAETGRAADSLGAHGDRVDQHYRDAAAAATATAEAGARIADRLDELAVAAAAEVTTIAAGAESAAAAVLTGDRSSDVVSVVTTACTAVTRTVVAHVESLTELGAALEPLTTPAVRLP